MTAQESVQPYPQVRRFAIIRRWLMRGGRSSTLLTQVVILVCNVLPSVLIARELGPASTGTYALFARMAALLLSVVSLSYAYGLAHVAAADGFERTAASWRGALILAVPQGVLGAVLLATVTGLAIQQRVAQVQFLLACFAMALVLQFVILAGQHLLRGMQDFAGFNLNRVAQAFAWGLVCLLIFLTGTMSLASVAAAWLLSQVLAVTLVLIRVRRVGVAVKGVEGTAWQPALRFGLRAHVGIVGRDIAPFIDQLVVVLVAGTLALGLYLPASTVSGLVLVVGVAMALVIQPRLCRASSHERAVTALRLVGQSMWVSLLAGAFCACVSPWLIDVFYGSAYELSGRIAVPLAGAVILDSATLAALSALIGLGRPGRASLIQMLGTVLLVTGLLVALQGGITRVPLAALVAYGVTLAIALVTVWRSLPSSHRRIVDLLVPVDRAAMRARFGNG